ncbi:hypothetical protein IFM89_006097 [Coptis chinensis]|uniref:Uncharacterized protein n=1 Tax=Coptis chinensis TaxID=261450 RepID=A0A835LA77_9MAGN|nr:hypothetical protein IFM89_006097 [Coptis chinensis]
MGRLPCCDKSNVKRGLWTAEEDAKVRAYVSENWPGNWTSVPKNAGLRRCGKSCRLRYTNYLRPDFKHDNFTSQEEELIISLHAAIGSRTHKDVKNHWNTKLRKKLCGMGIDPVTHRPCQMYEALVNTSEAECSNTINGEVSREKENEFFNDHIVLATNQVEGTHPQDSVEVTSQILAVTPLINGDEWRTIEKKKKTKKHVQRSPGKIDDPTLAMMKKVFSLARKKVKHLDGYIKEIWDERMGQTFACIHCGTFFREFDKAQKHVSKDHSALAKQFSKGK